MTLINCPANTWVKVVTNVSTCKILALTKGQYVHTYRTTGTTAPTAGDATEGVKAFNRFRPEHFNATSAIDVYVMAIGASGVVRVDSDLKYNGEKPVQYTGGLRFASIVTDGTNVRSPGDIIYSKDGRFAYAATTASDGLAWYSVDQESGVLAQLGYIKDASLYDNATTPAISPDGRHLYLAAKDTHSLSWFSLNQYTGTPTYVWQYANATNIPNCASVVVSRDGRHIYTGSTNTTTTYVAYWTRDIDTGAGTYVNRVADSKLKGAQTLIMSKDDLFVYAACSGTDSICWLARTPSTGVIAYTDRLQDATYLDGVRSITLSPCGQFMYAAAYDANNIEALSVNTSTGAVTSLAHYQSTSYASYVYNVCCAHDTLYAAARNNDQITVMKRDTTTGLLTFSHGVTVSGSTGTRCIALSPDNRFLAVTAITTHDVIGFKRMTI